MATRSKNQRRQKSPDLPPAPLVSENHRSNMDAIQEQISKFRFNEFKKENEEFRYYLQRFELEIFVAGLSGEASSKKIARRNLLLKSIGADIYRTVVDQFDPRSLFEVDYDEIVEFLQQYFAPNTSYL